MGLPASQRRILERIEFALRGSDPRLAALFSLFTRLNSSEDMPRVEQIRARVAVGVSRFLGPPARALAAATRWFSAPRRARLRTALFFPVALGLVACAVLVGSSFPSTNRCAAAPRAGRTAHSAARIKPRSKSCTPVVANPVIIGR
jgi:hypothetical protein